MQNVLNFKEDFYRIFKSICNIIIEFGKFCVKFEENYFYSILPNSKVAIFYAVDQSEVDNMLRIRFFEQFILFIN